MMDGVSLKDRAIGQNILENYKKQLADRLARNRVGKTGGDPSNSKKVNLMFSSEDKFLEQRMEAFTNAAHPDPRELLAILNLK